MPKTPLLVKASISLNGQTFHTFIREGASAEQLIEKVAKENGGGVAKVYYPEFKTSEIVAVKVGDQLLVKNDPKRVAEADFSDFADSDSVKEAAVSTASNSTGGIHFFVGKDGIPMAAAEDDGIVFPNGEELRINSNIKDLSLSAVEFNVDPKSLSDLDSLYKNGTVLSKSAREEIEQSHGGVRSEKLMLPDTSILILGRESGQIKTAAEFAGNIAAEGFAYKTQFQLLPIVPQNVMVGLSLPTDLGTMNIPFDGSGSRIPYSHVKLFDGNVTSAIKVSYLPFDGKSEFSGQQPSLPREEPVQVQEVAPSAPVSLQEPQITQTKQLPAARAPLKKSAIPFSIPKIPRAALPINTSPLPEPIKQDLPKQTWQKPSPKPIQAKTNSPKKPQVSGKKQRAAKPKPAKPVKKSRPKPLDVPKKKSRAKKIKPKKAKPKKSKNKIAMPKVAKPRKKKPKAAEKPEKKKPKVAKPKQAPGKKPAKPKKEKIKTPKKAAARAKTSTSKKVSSRTKKKLQTSVKKRRQKKKIQNYYFNTMIGLCMPKRGRTRARSSAQRRSAPRT